MSRTIAQASDPGGTRVALRHYRLFSRTPYMDVSSSRLLLHLPSYFGGKHDLVVPLSEVAVIDPTMTVDPTEGPPAVYVTPVRLPYFATTTSNVRANVVLLFATPQRIPPLRWGGSMTSGLGHRASRSVEGLKVDGVALRAVAAQEAIRAVAGAGATSVGDGDAWMGMRREMTHDPVAVAQVRSITRRNRVSYALTFVVIVLLGIARGVADRTNSWWPFLIIAVALLSWFGTRTFIGRRNERARQVISSVTQHSPPT